MSRSSERGPITGRPVAQRAGALHAGEAARALGVGVQTLHYYEREGLVPPAPRSPSGYRLYPPELVQRIAFVRKAQALGLPLAEIREILHLAEHGASPCGRVQVALADTLREVDERLRALRRFRAELADVLRSAPALRAHGGNAALCAIVEEAPPPRSAVAPRRPLAPRGTKRAR